MRKVSVLDFEKFLFMSLYGSSEFYSLGISSLLILICGHTYDSGEKKKEIIYFRAA